MIYIDSLSKSYHDNYIFSDVNLVIKKGMRIGLVGANGSGKSTFLKILLGNEDYDSGNVQTDRKISVGYLPQDIISGDNSSVLEETLKSFPNLKIIEQELNSLLKKTKDNPEDNLAIKRIGELQDTFEAIGGWTIETKAKKILSGLGFNTDQIKERVSTFSGGWRMRVVLASILLKNPDIIFLDEPTNHLDLEATIWLEKFLKEWRGSLVLISHDRTFLDKSVNHILEIELKKVFLFKGNYSSYQKEKLMRMEQHRSAYDNQQKKIKDTESFIGRFRYNNKKASQVQSRLKYLEKLKKIEPFEDNKKVLNLVIPQKGRSPLKLISCENVDKSYGENIVFKNLNFTVERTQKIGLVGCNGAGKSTLLKLLAGVIKPNSGEINKINNVSAAYYAQHQLEFLKSNDSIFDSVSFISNGASETEVRTYLGSFLFSGDDIKKNIAVLSGGEKARVALARMLIEPVDLLLLDEPTNHLDIKSRAVLENALKKYQGSIVCISHDRHFLNKVTNLTCEVKDGDVKTYSGNYDYYYWKQNNGNNILNEGEMGKKDGNLNKKNYKNKKKNKNRITWIGRRFGQIEKDIEQARAIIQNKENQDDYILLQEKIKEIEKLENEYLKLIDEKDDLINQNLNDKNLI